MGKSMGTKFKISLPLVVMTAALTSQPLWADAQDRAQAKRIHDRLTGVTATNDILDDMEDLLSCDQATVNGYACDPTGKTAAEYAIDTAQNPNARYFYNVTLKNFAAPWTNEEQSVFTPLNDYTATVVGLIRDGADFRRVLYDNVIYHANTTVNPDYSDASNAHYVELERLGPIAGDLSNPSILEVGTQTAITGLPAPATAGIMTTRAGAQAFYSAGTNRAMFRFTMMNHLCTDLEPLKDVTRPPDYVRRDVSRSPGGDSRIFLNNCVGCHAGMDGMAGAFAHYEWDGTRLLYQANDQSLFDIATGVSLKHNINENNFEYGYETVDDRWINYWRTGPNSKLGVRPADDTPTASGWGWNLAVPAEVTVDPVKGTASGAGARALGIELSGTRAFAQCQVDKAFKAVCLRDPNTSSLDRSARDGIVSNFVGSTPVPYNMREVFTDVAAYCKGS
jgi:hypothetical protein